MALLKTAFLDHLKILANPRHRFAPSFVTLRCLSFSTPEEAAAERRRRKRRLRVEPPLSSSQRSQQQAQQVTPPRPIQNPNARKLPEPVTALSGNRLNLHNKILKLIRENDLEEAALYTRHSVYSNCRPTIYTVNAVLNAQLRQLKYVDLLSLHRFIILAGIAPNVITHNLIFQTYLDCKKPDTALEHYKQFINESPVSPSPTTYRILVKGLVDNGKLEKAVEMKDEMTEKGLAPDPIVYSFLMFGCAKNGDSNGIFKLFEELKEKKDEVLDDGVVYGGLINGYFMKGMEKEAMKCYEEACGENSKLKISDVAYNYVLDALSKNRKFDEALRLFDRMKNEHNPPRRLAVNLGSFNVIVDGYCAEGKFKEAIDVFRSMLDYRCTMDTLSFNNLIDQLCQNGLVGEAEELYGGMGTEGVSPDEYTYVLLMDACFKVDRIDDGASYFRKMVEAGLRPSLAVYNRLVDELVKVGKVDEAKSFYDTMVKKLKMDDASYKFMMKALSDVGKLDDALKMVDEMLDEEISDFTEELQGFVKELLRNVGREDELTKLMEEKERLKAEAKAREVEAAEAAKRSAKAAVASLLPSKLFGRKEGESESSVDTENTIDASSRGEVPGEDESEGPIEEASVMGSDADSNAVDAKQPF
ncbi:Pentatricopeptide repeat-containing protein [Hibiscus syriacus]|uniref:Pentatricopeptide repeat-containing protein n=1 Tax=Hibiscus syriacus TaxID=106335 RepID=A0A6A3CCM8_HIBSY|nr:pentatricopeptide repeat-containing protein At3g49240, mitochondrial-like [Hibiscus syriacus]KAE8726447.1 Pentatricopeptide repeat-containing protein [Hibiscus syriacus]